MDVAPHRSLERHADTTMRNSRPIIFPTVLRASCFLSLAAICQRNVREVALDPAAEVRQSRSQFSESRRSPAHSGAGGDSSHFGVCVYRGSTPVAPEDEI